MDGGPVFKIVVTTNSLCRVVLIAEKYQSRLLSAYQCNPSRSSLFSSTGGHIDRFIQAGTDLDLFRRFDEALDERVFYRRRREHARGRGAALAGGTESAAVDRDGGFVEIGVGHDDDGVLATHLTGNFGAALRRFGIERAADFGLYPSKIALSTGD